MIIQQFFQAQKLFFFIKRTLNPEKIIKKENKPTLNNILQSFRVFKKQKKITTNVKNVFYCNFKNVVLDF